MLIQIILLCTCAKLSQSSIESTEFYNVNQEMPNLQRRGPKVLAPGVDNMISIKVTKQGLNENFYNGDYPVEEVDVNGNRAETPKTLQPLSNDGKQRVNEIGGHLLRMRTSPVALLIQDEPEVLRTSGLYMDYILRNPALQNDFWLMKFNASGVSGVIAKSYKTEFHTFRRLFSEDSTETKQNVGVQTERAASFFGLLKATRTLPENAAILLFTNAAIEDEDLAHLAIKETQNKQIRIFVVWQGAFPTVRQEYKLLKEAAEVTQGAFVLGNTERKYMTDINYVQVSGKANPVITHLTGVHGQQRVRVPIENGVSAIHVSLSNGVNKARFRTPKGYLIDLLNITDVARFARGSYVVKTAATFECELQLSAATPAVAVGVWRLETEAFAQRRYDIVVSARHALTVEADVVRAESNGQPTGKRRLHLNILGDYAKIENVTLIASDGGLLEAQYLRISVNDRLKAQDDIETFQPGGNVDIDLDDLPKQKFFIQVHGKDSTGNDFQRISYYNPLNIHKIIEPTTITLGEGSELSQIPGRSSNILYKVTNNRDNVIFMRFQATDERAYLRHLTPLWAWINPHQTLVATLHMISKGADDLVTFSASSGSDRIDKKAIVRSTESNNGYGSDTEVPHMWHKFTSNCQEVLFSRCEEHSWTLEVTAQDRESGLLLIQSSPEGLFFPQGYISGTTEEVTGVLSGSCCESGVVLTAIDIHDNRRSYEANAYWAKLGSAAIAAIVISILLVLLIIAFIVYCCVCGTCKRKQKASHDIPQTVRYRGPENSATTTRY